MNEPFIAMTRSKCAALAAAAAASASASAAALGAAVTAAPSAVATLLRWLLRRRQVCIGPIAGELASERVCSDADAGRWIRWQAGIRWQSDALASGRAGNARAHELARR